MQKGGSEDGVSQPGDDDDPEVTAITRKFNRTGDTLSAIGELEQLLIERTGQIPVVTPELMAAHAARTAQAAAPLAAETIVAEPEQIDWTIELPERLDPAPGFSDWVDPEAIAAAYEPQAALEFTDVSTKVFAVFSAERIEAERPVVAEPEPELEPEREPELEPEPEAAPQPAKEPEPSPEPERATPAPEPPAEPPRKRRFWPFGRR